MSFFTNHHWEIIKNINIRKILLCHFIKHRHHITEECIVDHNFVPNTFFPNYIKKFLFWSTFHLKKKITFFSLLCFITRKIELWIFDANHFTTAKPFKNSFADQIFSLENNYLLDRYLTIIILPRKKVLLLFFSPATNEIKK